LKIINTLIYRIRNQSEQGLCWAKTQILHDSKVSSDDQNKWKLLALNLIFPYLNVF